MPVPNNQHVLLDIVFVAHSAKIRLLGQALSVNAREEVFALCSFDFDAAKWWRPNSPRATLWEPVDVREAMVRGGASCLLSPPRQLKYYNSTELRTYAVANRRESELCSAVRFTKCDGDKLWNFVLSASTAYPCSLDYSVTDVQNPRLLSGMIELPDSWPHGL
jgi:hypothetical protein